jgi:DNA modification methylase
VALLGREEDADPSSGPLPQLFEVRHLGAEEATSEGASMSACDDGIARIEQGDVLERLREMADESVQCVVTSPPFWGLRDYDVEGQIGLEPTPQEHVARLVEVFREVRRVLRADGTLWLEYGDCYASSVNGTSHARDGLATLGERYRGGRHRDSSVRPDDRAFRDKPIDTAKAGLPAKNLMGMPWRVAFALQDDGWILRSDIIWSRPNPMPESVTDRPTKSHSYLFLFAKSARYYYDAEAIREEAGANTHSRGRGSSPKDELEAATSGRHAGWGASTTAVLPYRNRRSVWTIATQPYPEAHFATFPEALVEPCILAGTKPQDVVMDPFAGSGTTLAVAKRLDRRAVGIELNAEYIALAARRIAKEGAQITLPMAAEA